MFEKYFVTCDLAVQLRIAGFNEPCMAVIKHYKNGDSLVNQLIINYSNRPNTTEPDNDAMRLLLITRPELLGTHQMNSQLPQFLFAAPLYQQVFDWLRTKGLYIHDRRIPVLDGKKAELWFPSVNSAVGSQLWPAIPKVNYHEQIKKYYFGTEVEAWSQAILEALRILTGNKIITFCVDAKITDKL